MGAVRVPSKMCFQAGSLSTSALLRHISRTIHGLQVRGLQFGDFGVTSGLALRDLWDVTRVYPRDRGLGVITDGHHAMRSG